MIMLGDIELTELDKFSVVLCAALALNDTGIDLTKLALLGLCTL